MTVEILCVGKLKEAFFREAAAEYAKRLGRYVKLIITETADEKTPDGASEKEEDAIREKEAGRLLKALKNDTYVIVLEIEGRSFSSEEFAEKIRDLGVKGISHITFVIGGSLGLHPDITSRADLSLSFSRFTFPHQLMRVVLLEQIYRSFRIINNEPYHK